jgi:UDP-3-O-[3-hydroxymyristoyl] glucosamine N-acyltransferase
MWAYELAAKVNGRLLGSDVKLLGISFLSDAVNGDLSFVIWPKDINRAKQSQASLLITTIDIAAEYAHEFLASSILVAQDLHQVFKLLHELVGLGILKTRFRPPKIMVGERTHISNRAVVDDKSFIGHDCIIEHGAVIHPNVVIGNGCYIGANTVIGSPPFVPFLEFTQKNLSPLGFVIIKDNVSVGALCTIDQGLIGATTINSHTIIDNMVHIGHDVTIGSNVTIAAQTALAGFVVLEDMVCLCGQVGVSPFVKIGKGGRINGKSLVHCDVKEYEIWSGNPSMPHFVYLRAYSYLKRKFTGKNQ